MNAIQIVLGTFLLQSILFVNANEWEDAPSWPSQPRVAQPQNDESWTSNSWRSGNDGDDGLETNNRQGNGWDDDDHLPARPSYLDDDQDDDQDNNQANEDGTLDQQLSRNFIGRCFRAHEQWSFNPCPERTCETRNPVCLASLRRVRIGKCVCKPGYIRNNANKCILESRCQCPNNECWVQNGSPCQITCASFNQTCELKKPPLPINRCVCKQGYARRNGVCIPAATCPNRICKVAHSTINDCGSGRELKCINRRIVWGAVVTTSPRNRCGIRACYCDKGFVRDAINKQCIRASACKRRPITTKPPKPSDEPWDDSDWW